MQDLQLGKVTLLTRALYKPTCFKRKNCYAARIMKLTAIILLAACLQLSAKGLSQTITLTVKDASLQQVFVAIEKQTDYRFFYNFDILQNAKKVSVNAQGIPLKSVLEIIFKDQPVSYTIHGSIITVRSKKNESGELGTSENKQVIDVRGRVVNEKGEPVVASVIIKGTKIGVNTNENGEFHITGVDENSVLIISGVGIETTEIKVSGRAQLSIIAKIGVKPLDEVQMIAYGTTTKRFNTGNVSSIKSKDIETQPIDNPLLALQGRVPGIFVNQNTGIPGGGITVRIQGQNSIQSGNDPLYVVDGVPINSQLPRTGLDQLIFGPPNSVASNSLPSAGNPLSYLNPNDIESIDVLKDADATAIYGSRAANGAILITTKKGKAGKPSANINLNEGWGKVTRKLDMLNTRQYLDMRYEAFKNDGLPIPTSKNSNYDITLWDTTSYTDWQKVLIGNTAHFTNVNGSISGGTPSFQYIVSATYHKETTVFPFPKDFSDQKEAIHLNLNSISPNQKFKFQLTANYLLDNNQLPSVDLTQMALQLEPDAPFLYNSDGSLNWATSPSGSSTLINPLLYGYKKYKNKTNNLISNLEMGYNFFRGFELSGSVGYTNMQTDDFLPTPLLAIRPESRATTQRDASFGERNINSLIIEPKATYKINTGRLKLESLLGSTYLQNLSTGRTIIGKGQTSDQVLEDIRSAASLSVTNSFISQYKYNAIFARINLNWLDKYILNISGRRDGSSRFGSENRFHNFGSIGVAWIFTNESFVKNDLTWLSFGKLRGSIGSTGNDQIADYQFLNTYRVVNNVQVPYQGTTGLEPANLPNPKLKWEETRKIQLGLDLGLRKDKILISANYSINRSSNQLTPYALPLITGFDNFTENFPAVIQNSNLEFAINSTNLKGKNINWVTNLNLTVSRNKLIDFPNLETSSYSSQLVIGQPINIIKTFHFLGVDPLTGKYQFSDKNGNTIFPPSSLNDKTVLVNTQPKFYGGMQNTFTYKGFTFDFLFQFVKQIGQNLIYGFPGNATSPGSFFRGTSNQPLTIVNRWQNSGDEAQIQKVGTQFSNPQVSYAFASDAAFSDASYIRLKNASISWNFPKEWCEKIHLQNFRLYAQGQNLLTITHYKGLDPENQGYFYLPPLMVVIVGGQINF